MTLATEILFLKGAIVFAFACMIWESRSAGKLWGSGGAYLVGAVMGLVQAVLLIALTAGVCLGIWFLFAA